MGEDIFFGIRRGWVFRSTIMAISLWLTNCHWDHGNAQSLDQFTQQFQQLMLSADQSDFLSPEYANGEEISRPPRATVKLLRIRAFAGKQVQSACLLYQIPLPHQQIYGVLKVVDESCEMLAPTLDERLILGGIQQLRIQMLNSKVGGLGPFAQLRLNFSYNGQDQEILLPIWNLKRGGDAQIFRSSVQVAYGSGLIVLGRPSLQNGELAATEDPLQGSKDASYLNHDYLKCREVDEDCQIIKDQCHLCRYGHFPVASNQKFCPGNWERFCGPNRCGERGQMACVRGQLRATDANSMGFCPEPLQGYFDNDGILVCL